jgi:glycosyltransferase involved in cell wall biosynthesis
MYKEVRVASVYQNVDAFLTASTSETCGLSALEALASGLPIVVPDTQGLRDLVQHEETGLLFEPGDIASAQKAVRRLVNDHERRRRLSERAFQFGQMHTSRSATDWLIALSAEVIQERRSLKTRRWS